MPLNFEFKARCQDLLSKESILLTLNPRFAGEDHQVDTYFDVPNGRLKLREGNIENALIFYKRSDDASAKTSEVTLYDHPNPVLKQMLSDAVGVKMVVDKWRRIYFIENVKFHFDTVRELGCFIEVEAIDADGSIGVAKLKEQCDYYSELLQVHAADMISGSYSDLLSGKKILK